MGVGILLCIHLEAVRQGAVGVSSIGGDFALRRRLVDVFPLILTDF